MCVCVCVEFRKRNDLVLRPGDTEVTALGQRHQENKWRADKDGESAANFKIKYLQGNSAHQNCTQQEINSEIYSRNVCHHCLSVC